MCLLGVILGKARGWGWFEGRRAPWTFSKDGPDSAILNDMVTN